RSDTFGRGATNRARDRHHLGAIDLSLNDFPQFLGFGVDDADAVHLGTGVAARRGKGVRVHVVDLSVPRRPGYIHELTTDAHHRQPGPRVHQHTLTADRRQQAHLRRTDDRARPHRDVTGLDVVAGATDVGARAHPTQHRDPRLA